jgi:hypothetical protein
MEEQSPKVLTDLGLITESRPPDTNVETARNASGKNEH